jgi:hypothetical protein
MFSKFSSGSGIQSINSRSCGLLFDLVLGVPGFDFELDGLDKFDPEFEAFIKINGVN